MKRPRGRHLEAIPQRRAVVIALSSAALAAVVVLVPSMPTGADTSSPSTSIGAEPEAVQEPQQDKEQPQESLDTASEPVATESAQESPEAVLAFQESVGRLVVPQVGIDAPVLSYALTAGIADPPAWTGAYVVDGYGSPSDPASGTSYVLVHSGYRGEALGDLLTDAAAKESHLEAGDRLHVDGVQSRWSAGLATPRTRSKA